MRRIFFMLVLIFCLAPILLGQAPAQGPGVLPVLPRVNITVLVENMAGNPSLLGEWGLSFLIETDKHRVLLDAGGGRTLFENAKALEVDLSKIEAIVISHGHFDHTGGLEKTLDACGPVDLFIHPAAFATRYFKEGSRMVKDENPLSLERLRNRVRRLNETLKPAVVCEGLMVTGEVPRQMDFEDTGVGHFIFLDPDMKTPDLVPDDQAVYFRVPEGVVILLGCAHAGIINTARYVSKLVGEEKIYAVMGGTHLISASPRRIQETIEALRQLGVQKIMLSHCTGLNAYAALAGAFPGLCAWPATGSKIRFGGH